MKRLTLITIMLSASSALACEDLGGNDVQDKVSAFIVSGPAASAQEICTVIGIVSPILIDTNGTPDALITNAAILKSSGTLLSVTALSTSVEEGRYVSTGCLPLSSDYKVKIVLNYHPNGYVSLCPQKIVIEDLLKFIESPRNE